MMINPLLNNMNMQFENKKGRAYSAVFRFSKRNYSLFSVNEVSSKLVVSCLIATIIL